jgi:hypothetical protein
LGCAEGYQRPAGDWVRSSGRRISLQRPTCGRPGPHIRPVARIAPLGRGGLNFLSAALRRALLVPGHRGERRLLLRSSTVAVRRTQYRSNLITCAEVMKPKVPSSRLASKYVILIMGRFDRSSESSAASIILQRLNNKIFTPSQDESTGVPVDAFQ